jgi:phosphoribosylformylglycinamidine (FGAM) synthase-like enzyme
MNSSAHIPLEMLIDIAEDRATERREAAMAHVAGCSACGATLDRLQRLVVMMRSDTAMDAPRDVLLSTLNMFAANRESRKRETVLPRIIAVLTFDSRHAGAAVGLRSVYTASRQMLYSAQDTDVDLRIAVQNEECIVAGQVIRRDCIGGRVKVAGTAASAETDLNELCEFTLPAVPLGTYALVVRLHDLEIEIPELELKA